MDKTININGFEVPEPVREGLKYGDFCYLADITQTKVMELYWTEHSSDFQFLYKGIVHRTRKAAETHIKALLSFTQQ